MREHATRLGSERTLVGIVSEPAREHRGDRPAVVLISSGLDPRAGTSRFGVRLARRLCRLGYLVVRFDHGGVGDSRPRTERGGRRETHVAEVREIMDDLQRDYGVARFLLIGHCSGAVTSFKTSTVDPRVVGVVSINAHGFDPNAEWHRYVDTERSWRHYSTRALRSPRSWGRALRGRIDFRLALTVLWRVAAQRLSTPREVSAVHGELRRELRELVRKGTRVLFVLTEGDDAEEYFDVAFRRELQRLSSPHLVGVEQLRECDHDFTLRSMQAELFERIEDWLAAWGDGR